MCDDCTDDAWNHYYTLLEKVQAVVENFNADMISSAFGMAQIREIVRAEEAT